MLLLLPFLFLGLAPGAHAQLPTRVQVTGLVTDARTGKPVYECLVEHYDPAGKRWGLTTVNSEGRYSLFIPTGEAFELRVVDENGYRPMREQHGPLPADARTWEHDLHLEPR